jgi:virulence factor Mce-like protein
MTTKYRRTQHQGMSYFKAGMIATIAILVVTYLGFTKSIPFRGHWEIAADVRTTNNLKPNSFVRIAGVNVGKVVKVEKRDPGSDVVRVVMRIDKKGRPIHKDATLRIRPRIFLEGNFFVDLQPGSPSAPVLEDGDVLPATQASAPVQLDQVLTALQSDTRADLSKLLRELATGLNGKGALGYNRSIKYWESAFRDSAYVNDATLGQQPDDLSTFIRGQAKVAAALDRDPQALQGLLTDFNRTAAAFAAESDNLERAIGELPKTVRNGADALYNLNNAFPPLRRLVADLRPAVRSSGPALEAGIPFVKQARGLVSENELRGLTRDARPLVPRLSRLTRGSQPLMEQVRSASSCQNEVIMPWTRLKVPDPNFPANGPVYQESVQFLPGIAGESRNGDANGQWFRVLGANGVNTYEDGGIYANTLFPLLGANPPKSKEPPIRYDQPCENQEVPNLATEAANPPTRVRSSQAGTNPTLEQLANIQAIEWLSTQLLQNGRRAEAKAAAEKAIAMRDKLGLVGKTFGLVKGKFSLVNKPKVLQDLLQEQLDAALGKAKQ